MRTQANARWLRISLHYATYGIRVKLLSDGRKIVVDAAPIARWMIGKDLTYCIQWVHRKDPKATAEWL